MRNESLLNYVPYVLSCPTCLVPYVPRVLRTLVPHVPRALCASCALRALMPLVSYALSCLTCSCLVPYVHSCPTYIVPDVLSCHTCSRALCFTCFRVSLVLRALVCFTCLTCSCTSRVFCLAFSLDARDSDSTGLVLLNFELFYRTIVSFLFYKKSLTPK